MKIAVIDLGTNSIHMQIVQVHGDGTYHVLGGEKDMTRLGDGSFKDGRLKASATQRAVGVVSRFAKIAENRGVRKIIAFATSAVREAANGPDLLLQIQKKTGIKVRVITGQEEARLIFRAVHQSIPREHHKLWCVDIGGGSVEINAARDLDLLLSESLKLGVARLRDLYLKDDPPTQRQWQKLNKHVRKVLKKALAHMRDKKFHSTYLVGTSGTVQNITQMAHRLHHKEPLLLMNGATLDTDDLDAVTRALLKSEPRERTKIPGIDPTRADQILGGCALLRELMDLLHVRKLVVCDKGIREGVILDYVDQNLSGLRDLERIRDVRKRSVLALARRFAYDAKHASQVANLALSLFDQTRALHRLDGTSRNMIEYAALLHDIGYLVGYTKHHKHAYYLITNCGLDGFSPLEVEVLANIVRYHRKSFPKSTHPNFARLNKPEQERVRKLAALLRLAEGLDRSHSQLIKSVQCRKNGKSLFLRMHAKGDPELELWGAKHKQDLFVQVFQKPVLLRCKLRGREMVGL